MRIDIITAFPEIFSPLETSIMGRAGKAGRVEFVLHPLRQFAINRYGQIDDSPFGGEAGMVLRPEPMLAAIDAAKSAQIPESKPHTIYMSPQGRTLNQERARELSKLSGLIILCGHYKGIDQRIIDAHVDEELSIGDYVLTGGELPAMVLIDTIVRLLPDVLHDRTSAETDSFFEPNRLGWPVYTRPEIFEGMAVPKVLLSGHHENIRRWRLRQSLLRTRRLRPDLFEKLQLTKEEQRLLAEDAD